MRQKLENNPIVGEVALEWYMSEWSSLSETGQGKLGESWMGKNRSDQAESEWGGSGQDETEKAELEWDGCAR